MLQVWLFKMSLPNIFVHISSVAVTRLQRSVLLFCIIQNNFIQPRFVSSFGAFDADGVCVFGRVEAVYSCPPPDRCEDGGCQIRVAINEICIDNSFPGDQKLVVKIKPMGQTLQTLNLININLMYQDGHTSEFIVRLSNLNGHHKDLLEELPMEIPLDDNRITSGTGGVLFLEVSSDCSCNAKNEAPDFIDFRVENLNVCPKQEKKFCQLERETKQVNMIVYGFLMGMVFFLSCSVIIFSFMVVTRMKKFKTKVFLRDLWDNLPVRRPNETATDLKIEKVDWLEIISDTDSLTTTKEEMN